ncbi:MAG: chloride channel protein [Gemella haemolysans]|uniref:chloride channel protein n=1 Tax=Gemella haemolysans TaxID=1379 RepID=UPI00290C88C4|nr:chloride channel protein [Gemella haemolysans]MDU6573010.1 chloride channel protein [Gemella haemolysans]
MFKNYYIRLVSLILLIAVCCSVFGQILLKLIEITSGYYKYLIVLTPLILIFTKFSNKYLKTNMIGMKYFIEAATDKKDKVSWSFPFILTLNTLLAHGFGVSVGREGVAVQLGGAIGGNLAGGDFSDEKKQFFVKLGMICGFAGLFQTPLAAVVFILEVVGEKFNFTVNKVYEYITYIIGAYISAFVSHKLGLEKFFVRIDVSKVNINIEFLLKIILIGIVFVFVGIFFVVIQRKIKEMIALNGKISWILLIVFILVSFIFEYRYASLGTNLIGLSFTNFEQIQIYDFILKIILTAICTGIGFSGGEVTPLFAIGATCGVILGTYLGLPILVTAALGYCLVFSAATKTYIAPILLALEVFGYKLMFFAIVPAFLIYLINKKYSIYK